MAMATEFRPDMARMEPPLKVAGSACCAWHIGEWVVERRRVVRRRETAWCCGGRIMLSCCCWVEGRVRPPRKKHERGEYTGIGSDFVMEKKGLATLKDRSEASYTKISLQSLHLPNIRSELEAESHQRAKLADPPPSLVSTAKDSRILQTKDLVGEAVRERGECMRSKSAQSPETSLEAFVIHYSTALPSRGTTPSKTATVPTKLQEDIPEQSSDHGQCVPQASLRRSTV